jgi:osmotically-inducible protein OsmY
MPSYPGGKNGPRKTDRETRVDRIKARLKGLCDADTLESVIRAQAGDEPAAPDTKSRSQRIRECLNEGPGTSLEVALELGLSKRNAHVGIWVLREQGHVQISGKHPREGQRKNAVNIYELTARGRAALRLYGGPCPATQVEKTSETKPRCP